MSDSGAQVAATTSSARGDSVSHGSSGRTLRRVVEAAGWLGVGYLIFVGLEALIERALFMNAVLAEPPANPAEALGPFLVRYFNSPIAVILHLVPGVLVMVLGPLQFVRLIRRRWIRVHRLSGSIFLLAGGVSALSGIAIGVFDPFLGVTGQGFSESMATAFFSVFTLFCLCMALMRIRQRRVPQHREWMIRSWAMLLSVATERVLLRALQANTEIGFADLFAATFWMSFAINLALAESWITLSRTPGSGIRHWKERDAAEFSG